MHLAVSFGTSLILHMLFLYFSTIKSVSNHDACAVVQTMFKMVCTKMKWQ